MKQFEKLWTSLFASAAMSLIEGDFTIEEHCMWFLKSKFDSLWAQLQKNIFPMALRDDCTVLEDKTPNMK